MKYLLAVTCEFDPHMDVVLSHYHKPCIRVDIEDLIKGTSSLSCIDGQATIQNSYSSISINEIQSVYWRKPLINPEKFSHLSEKALNEWFFYLENFAALLQEAHWINPPNVYWLASKKLYQLSIARYFGLKTPHYICTNKLDIGKNFFDENTQLLYKSIVTQHCLQGTSLEKNFGNTLILPDDIDQANSIPGLVQEFLSNRVAEWRITIVGKNVFAARIPVESKEYIDIKEIESSSIEKNDIPKEIECRLLEFMDHFNMEFCAFDFLETSEKELYFLEANPNGQWLWIEAQTGFAIGKSIANLLLQKS